MEVVHLSVTNWVSNEERTTKILFGTIYVSISQFLIPNWSFLVDESSLETAGIVSMESYKSLLHPLISSACNSVNLNHSPRCSFFELKQNLLLSFPVLFSHVFDFFGPTYVCFCRVKTFKSFTQLPFLTVVGPNSRTVNRKISDNAILVVTFEWIVLCCKNNMSLSCWQAVYFYSVLFLIIKNSFTTKNLFSIFNPWSGNLWLNVIKCFVVLFSFNILKNFLRMTMVIIAINSIVIIMKHHHDHCYHRNHYHLNLMIIAIIIIIIITKTIVIIHHRSAIIVINHHQHDHCHNFWNRYNHYNDHGYHHLIIICNHLENHHSVHVLQWWSLAH